MPKSPQLIAAPSNLGLRPAEPGHEPGTWRAPEAILCHLPVALTRDAIRLARRPYRFGTDVVGTIGNGAGLRAQTLEVSERVEEVMAAGRLPVVVGGDCSLLLGGLLAMARRGRVGLVHVDGHSDFYHPGNYDPRRTVNSAAGMDLALATGRGEPLLARWDGVDAPLVADADVAQIGEREELDPDYAFADLKSTSILSLPVRRVASIGVADAAQAALDHVAPPFWLHIDLDVLDADVLDAVDSPGRPGLSWQELEILCSRLVAGGRVVGLTLCIYDPDRDPDGRHAPCIAGFLETLLTTEAFRRS